MARLFIGPLPSPVTGQSAAFQVTLKIRSPEDITVYHSVETVNKGKSLALILSALVRTVYHLLSSEIEVSYISISRSTAGFVRDALLMWCLIAAGVPIVVHLHGADFLELVQRARWLRPLVIATYARVRCAIIPDRAMEDQFRDFPEIRISVASSYVEDSLRGERPRESLATSPDVVFMSNVLEGKGIVELIQAVDYLVAGGVNIRLLVVGKELDESLDTMLRRRLGNGYEIGSHVVRLGPLYGLDRLRVMRPGNIFALLSYDEAFPLSVLEAMYCGCAVIVSTCRYLPKIFAGSGAVFVGPRDWRSAASAIQGFIDSPALREESIAVSRAFASGFSEERYLAAIRRALSESVAV